MSFDTVPSWHRTATKNWTIKPGGGISAAAVLVGQAQLFSFTHRDLKKTYTFVYVAGGAGATIGAKLAGIKIGSVLGSIGEATQRTTEALGNPTSVDGLDTIKVHNAFSFYDLVGATGGQFTAGVTAGASAGAKLFAARSPGRTLFSITGATIELSPGVQLNVGSLTAGFFFSPSGEFQYHARRKFNRLKDVKPSERYDTHPGKI